MQASKFEHLTAKPTLACTANCETCSSRRALHHGKRTDAQLSVDQWKTLFTETRALGMKRLTFSGGEPTLYPDLTALIAEGKQRGCHVGINTNGSLINPTYALKLINAGLNDVMVSIYSGQPEFHDRIRHHPGLWQKATNAIQTFVKIREEQAPNFRVSMQTILCKDNFHAFPDLVALACRLRVNSILFSYLAGDFTERRYLLDEAEIAEFKQQIIPRAVQALQETAMDARQKRGASEALNAIYPVGNVSLADYAMGIYRSPLPCTTPSRFSIILANGDVHPCNMVEHTHEPVMGNVLKQTFTELWQHENWASFRQKGFEFCRYCPVPVQVHIPIVQAPARGKMSYLRTPCRLFSSLGRRLRERLSRPGAC